LVVELFDALAQENPDKRLFLVYRARAIAKKGALFSTVDAWESLANKLLERPGPYVELGQLYEANGLLDKALAAYQNALKRDPNCAPAQHGLVQLYEGRGDLLGATEAARERLRLDPTDALAATKLVDLYERRGLLTRAVEGLTQLYDSGKKSLAILDALSSAEQKSGALPEAERLTQRLVAAAPASVSLWTRLRDLYKAEGKTSAADRADRVLETLAEQAEAPASKEIAP